MIKKIINKKTRQKIEATVVLVISASIIFAQEAYCSKALEKISEGTTSIHKLVMGPLGALVLITGSLIGGYKTFTAGSPLGAIAIVVVGMLFGWHISSIADYFPN